MPDSGPDSRDETRATPFQFLHAVSLLGHKSRIEKYKRAIENSVHEDSLVVDIGSGSGILGMLAAKAGAERVICVEINEDALAYSRRVAHKNGLASRMEFFSGDFRDFVPDSRADIVICEMLSSFMLVEQQIPAMLHARKHILKPGGILLPNHLCIYMVPVQCDAVWSRFNHDGIEFQPVPQTVDRRVARDLADLAQVREFTLGSNDESQIVDESLDYTVCSDGILHGFVGMFEADLIDGTKLSMEDGWRELFMPVESPLRVKKGQSVRAHVRFIPGAYDTLRLDAQVSAQ
ncbi:methyltransferase domain-containing protein [Candidatus Thorarchaeota archaeon]|nr:MAG: methyltransferase domain-containing protein [Candidatus Thorarchaeota archaeon]